MKNIFRYSYKSENLNIYIFILPGATIISFNLVFIRINYNSSYLFWSSSFIVYLVLATNYGMVLAIAIPSSFLSVVAYVERTICPSKLHITIPYTD